MTDPVSPDPLAPLGGRRVVDAARWVAGPFAARLFGLLGADVLRLEGPAGDPCLELGHDAADLGRCLHDAVNADKTIERTTRMADRLREELAGAAILVCDWTPAEQDRLGLRLADLRDEFPGLVIVSVTGYGLSGHDRNAVASELVSYHFGGEAATLPGPAALAAFPDRGPVRGGRFLADYDAGLTAALAGLAAHLQALVSGRGSVAEIAGTEVELSLNRTMLTRSLHEGTDFNRSYLGYDYAGTLRCRDGYICLRPTDDRAWAAFAAGTGVAAATDERFATRHGRFVHMDELTALLQAWSAHRTMDEVRTLLIETGCPGGPFLTPRDVLADAAIASRGVLQPVAGGGRAPAVLWRDDTWAADAAAADRLRERLASGEGRRGPLTGVAVLDLTWVAAGPYSAQLLGYLGAEVLKVETAAAPDLFRVRFDDPDGGLDSSVRFQALNVGKRSVRLNLKHGNGLDAFHALGRTADVLVENYRPGVRSRLGIDDAALQERNPHLVVASLSGFGATSSDASRPGFASVFNAESGIGALTGYPDFEPTDIRDSNDLRAGTVTALAAVAGLVRLLRFGRASSFDVAARDALILLQADAILQASRGADPLREGNRLAGVAEYDGFRCADGRWVVAGARTRPETVALAALTGGAPLAQWCAGRSAVDAVRELRAVGLSAGPTVVGSDLLADAHLRARGTLQSVASPTLGELLVVGAPFRFDAAGLHPVDAAPRFGADTAAVLTARLGLGDDQVRALEASGALH